MATFEALVHALGLEVHLHADGLGVLGDHLSRPAGTASS